ncbi:hypothetical protein COLO4_21786 [Corchorus olitorius]|uniref:Uncharacterized protein n=1 Tax=Corchorus olitorius TaxID=93759 RepID=A0A1R3IR30_9ROSI|nr:hypothetical protein COLO4_21786 [Corchorus olitorius]
MAFLSTLAREKDLKAEGIAAKGKAEEPFKSDSTCLA